jgi:hypothetical protein
MRECKCGNGVADNARTCPKCGHRFTSLPVKMLAWFFVLMAALVVLVLIVSNSSDTPSSYKPAPASPQPTSAQAVALSKAKSDAEAKTGWLFSEMSLLQGNMKNPGAFKPASVFLTSEGRACVNYMSTNSFGAALQGWAILEKSGVIWTNEAAESRWHSECTGKGGTQQWTDVLGGQLISVSPAPASPTPIQKSTAAAAQGGEAEMLIAQCGKPDKDFTKIEGGQPARHIIYKRQNVELMYSRWNVPTWVLTNIFEANGDDTMETAEANRRLPCAAGSIHTVLDRP